MAWRSADLDFGLEDVIVPTLPRPFDAHRLLVFNTVDGSIEDDKADNLFRLLRNDDVLVFNESRVRRVALYRSDGTFVLVIEPSESTMTDLRVICPFKPSVGDRLDVPGGVVVLVDHEPGWDVYRARLEPYGDVTSLDAYLDEYAQFPLPIYIERLPDREDESRMQGVFARKFGSIAPPVAASHFSPAAIARAAAVASIVKVTLHVGYGTFRSLKSEYVADHEMDSEFGSIEADGIDALRLAKRRGGRVIAVGTTAARLLETIGPELMSPSLNDGWSGLTNIFIQEGYEPTVVDGLITNFQYPRLPVIAMAASFVGLSELRTVYYHAIDAKYSFYSYGDAMLLFF